MTRLVGSEMCIRDRIDGLVRLLPPEKISKTYKAGEFTRARIVGVEGHDLIAVPI
jgi:ribosomal protein S12 methylthiotransferase